MTLGQKIAQLKDKVTGHNTHTTGVAGANTTAYETTPGYSTGYVGEATPATAGVTNEYEATREYETTRASGYNTSTGMADRAVAEEGMVCAAGDASAPVPTGEKRFTVPEDHIIEKERRERVVEHTPIEREYKTTVAPTGTVIPQAGYSEGHTVAEHVLGSHTCYPVGKTVVEGVQGVAEGNRHVAHNTGVVHESHMTTNRI